MSIEFRCGCGKRLSAPAARAGQSVRCPACGKPVAVPGVGVGCQSDLKSVWDLVGGAAEACAVALTVLEDPADAASRAAPPPAAGGEALGRHLVLGELGAGGMGKILLVRDPELNRELAAKVILGRSQEAGLLQKFLVEAQVTGQLEHPNIIPVHELGLAADRRVYFTMKRVRGRDLAAILGELREKSSGRRERPGSRRRKVERADAGEPRGADSLGELLPVFLKVCDAIAFAHSRGVIHRDLKPANVMTGEFGEVLVMDWGLAKIEGHPDTAEAAVAPDLASGAVAGRVLDGGANPLRTQDGALMGTPAYMPPEQARGEVSRIDRRSDIYSLGAILYEILALEPAFTGKTPWAVIEKVSRGELVPPSRRAPHRAIPRELEAAVMKAMAPEPDDRYQSVALLRRDIEAYLSGHTLAAARYNPWEVLVKWAKRNKPIVFGAAAAILALVSGLAAMALATRARKVSAAEELHAQGERDWGEAESGHPFNAAAPQDYFRHHVAALEKSSRSLELHPSPPEDWKSDVARRANELQDKAQEVGDWALAQILAESPYRAGAVGEGERETRLVAVDRAFEDAAKKDRDALDALIDLVEKQSEKKAEGEGEKQGGLIEGELEERARRLAAATKPELSSYALFRLQPSGFRLQGSGEEQGPRGVARIVLLEVLGRKANANATAGGVTFPDAVRKRLAKAQETHDPREADEVAAWITAGSRLEARSPGALREVGELVEQISAAFENRGPVAASVERARTILAGTLPAGAPLELRRAVFEERAESLATNARSGSVFTRELVGRLAAALDAGRYLAAAALEEELGLRDDRLPPDPDDPENAAIPALRRAFDATWEAFRAPASSAPTREAAQEAAIAAVIALSRLGDALGSRALFERRYVAGEFSPFGRRTLLAVRLLFPSSWVETPVDAVGCVQRGFVRQAQGDLGGAIADFTRAIEFDSSFVNAYTGRGDARSDQGDLRGAIADYTRAIELAPNDAFARNNRGNARKALGDLAGAIADCTRAIELDPNYAMAYNIRGAARLDQGDLNGAIADFTRAIELDPNIALAYANRGGVRLNQGDLNEAVADCTRAIELDPNLAIGYNNRGAAREAQGNLAGAIADCTRAIELDQDFAVGYSNRGNARRAQGDLAGAIADYTRVIELDPNYAAGYHNRGAAREAQGDQALALRDFTRATELDGTIWQAWWGRAATLAALGRRDEAAASFARAIELAPDSQRASVEATRRRSLGE
ncbi:MAG: tetratricopeptide repeat protein [Planctomycetes bacterium]|nr:tetratricopeptide repeat protein [Planctomycetota bacterium]